MLTRDNMAFRELKHTVHFITYFRYILYFKYYQCY